MNSLETIKDEKGGVLVVALLILVLLTLIGMAATDTTNIELQVSGNEKVYKQAFYAADAGVAYAVAKGSTLVLDNNAAADPDDSSYKLVYRGDNPNSPDGIPDNPDMPSQVLRLSFKNLPGTSPKRIEVRSTGSAQGGGESVIIAGIEFVTPGKQQGPGNQTSYGN